MVRVEKEETINIYSDEDKCSIDIVINSNGKKKKVIQSIIENGEEVILKVKLKSNSNIKNSNYENEDAFWGEVLNM